MNVVKKSRHYLSCEWLRIGYGGLGNVIMHVTKLLDLSVKLVHHPFNRYPHHELVVPLLRQSHTMNEHRYLHLGLI
jgi:hypothetical protein